MRGNHYSSGIFYPWQGRKKYFKATFMAEPVS